MSVRESFANEGYDQKFGGCALLQCPQCAVVAASWVLSQRLLAGHCEQLCHLGLEVPEVAGLELLEEISWLF